MCRPPLSLSKKDHPSPPALSLSLSELGTIVGDDANCLRYVPQTVMVLKYLIKQYPLQTLYFGIANVVANGLIMLR